MSSRKCCCRWWNQPSQYSFEISTLSLSTLPSLSDWCQQKINYFVCGLRKRVEERCQIEGKSIKKMKPTAFKCELSIKILHSIFRYQIFRDVKSKSKEKLVMTAEIIHGKPEILRKLKQGRNNYVKNKALIKSSVSEMLSSFPICSRAIIRLIFM